MMTTLLMFKHELMPIALSIVTVGTISLMTSRDFLNILINTEIAMLGMNFYLITASMLWGDYWGQMYAICILALTAAETAIGLGLLILLYRTRGSVKFYQRNMLHGNNA